MKVKEKLKQKLTALKEKVVTNTEMTQDPERDPGPQRDQDTAAT